MQQQTLTVAVIVVVTFAAGFFTGRMFAPAPAAVASAPPAAPMAPMGTTPFPMAGPQAPAPQPSPHPTGEAPAAGESVSGTIAEVIQVPNFTYLRLSSARGDEWAAISANQQVAVGQQVTITNATLMSAFASKTLNRTFDSIWFGQLGN